MFVQDHHKTAFIHRDRPISYRELLSRITSFAGAFRIKTGDRVALCAENRPEWIYAFYAIWQNGGIPVPLDPTAAPSDLAVVLRDCRPSLALCSGECAGRVKQALRTRGMPKTTVRTLESLPDRADGPATPVTGGAPDDTAIIMYTSGTTGAPKGVMLSFANLAASIRGVASLGMLTADDRMLGLLPFYHIFPLQGTVIAPMQIGATVVMVASLSPEDILATLQKHRVTMFLGVPKLYELFHAGIVRTIRANPVAYGLFRVMRRVNSVRAGRVVFRKVHAAFGGQVHSFLTGGAPMDATVARELWSLGFRLVEGYGLTETAPLVAFNPIDRIKLGSVGKPMAGTEVKIDNGEVLVRGENVMKGYYRNPTATAGKIRDGWFHTGDLGRFDDDGYLYLEGRVDEMIVLPSGKNINPDEIERAILSSSPYVAEIGVFAHRGHLTALVRPDFAALERDGIGTIAETIKWKVIDAYNARVPGHKKVLGVVITRDELPRTRLGKLKRFRLPEIAAAARPSSGRAAGPTTPEYGILKRFLTSHAGMEALPDHHLELDLGLDSLDRVELLVFIESAFGVSLDERDLAQFTTVARLAELVARRKTRAKEAAVDWRGILQASEPLSVRGGMFLMRIVRGVARPFLRIVFRLRYRGLEHLPQAPFILSPNHQSFIDVLLLAVALPDRVLRNTFFIARESLARRALVRALTRRTNIIFVNFERDVKTALQKAASILKAGRNLVIFPEGHRTRDGRIAPFKKTFAILGAELQVPVVPVAIRGAYEALPAAGRLSRPRSIELTFCAPVRIMQGNYAARAESVRSIIRGVVERA